MPAVENEQNQTWDIWGAQFLALDVHFEIILEL